MKIQYASDLHLEFPENENYLRQHQLEPRADVLLLAGDIVPFNFITDRTWFFDYLSKNFQMTYWVPGNHEYYHSDLSLKRGAFLQKIRSNVFLVNDYAVSIENVRLIFSTLWTKVKPENQIAVERRMNDFHVISKMGNRLTCQDLSEEHEHSLAFIKKELAEDSSSRSKIVVTHHVPTFMNYPPEYLGDELNEAFAVELKDLITISGPDYWLYGHHHQNTPDFKIGNTTMITNQLGYVRYNEGSLFGHGKVLELG